MRTKTWLGLCAVGWLVASACGGDSSRRPPPINEDPDAGVDPCDVDGDRHDAVSCGGDDCDDANADAYPGAAETPCGPDLNCDGIAGPDADGDGHLFEECGGDDCNDGDATAYPGATDQVGAGDQDCDGVDGVDADGDHVASVASGGTDCNDADPNIYPAALDMAGDGTDQDCDGIDGVDADSDGVASAAFGGTDCNDADATILPGATDQYGDNIDQNCDGIDGVDADGDGYASVASNGEDCNDADPAIHPFAQGDWLWETLSESMRGDPPVAALDSEGNIWVAYVEEDGIGTNQIILANDGSGAWEFETIAPSPYCVAMALDQDDHVHLVYRNAGEIPQYATNASGAWVVEPIGGNQAIANCTVKVAPNGVVHTIFSTEALAVTHGQRSVDDWLFDEVAEGDVVTTDVSFQIDARNVMHVAYSDNGGVHYASTATAGYADTNEAGAGDGGTAPFNLDDGDTLVVAVDGGGNQTVTFVTADFVNIDAATAQEVMTAINEQLTGAVATVFGNNSGVRITSSSAGPDSVISLGASTAIDGTKLDMSAGAGGRHRGGYWGAAERVDPGQTAYLALLGTLPTLVYQGDPRMSYAERTGPPNDPWQTNELFWDSVNPHLTFDTDGRRHAAFGDVATSNVVWARSSDGVLWASEPVQPTEGNETVGRVLIDADNEPVFFIVEELAAETSLHVVRLGPVDGIDQDCDGRVR